MNSRISKRVIDDKIGGHLLKMMQKHKSHNKLKTSPKNVVLKNPAPFNLPSKVQATQINLMSTPPDSFNSA